MSDDYALDTLVNYYKRLMVEYRATVSSAVRLEQEGMNLRSAIKKLGGKSALEGLDDFDE
jgi:hypothetical protein